MTTRGNRATVVADASATRALPAVAGGPELSAEQVHNGALATITELWGIVVPTQASLN